MGSRHLLAATVGLALISTACGQSPGSASKPSASPVSTTTPSPADSSTPGPQGFQGVDLSFVSDSEGWALGQVACPALVHCAAIEHTGDSGKTWSRIPAPATVAPNGIRQIDCFKAPGCIDSIRFASQKVGYAFGPSLFHTLDGGRTWQAEADSVPTLGLEYVGQSAFRIAGTPGTLDCFGGCHLQRTAATGGTWQETGVVIPMAGARIVPEGNQRIYVFGLANAAGGAQNKKATIYYSRDSGTTWKSRTDPCPGTSFTTGAVAAPTLVLAILCRAETEQTNEIIRSDDGGITFHPGMPAPFDSSLAAGSATTLSGAASEVDAWAVQTSVDGGAHWQQSATCPFLPFPLGRLLALGYQDARTAHFICPETSVWRSSDGGASWTQAGF